MSTWLQLLCFLLGGITVQTVWSIGSSEWRYWRNERNKRQGHPNDH